MGITTGYYSKTRIWCPPKYVFRFCLLSLDFQFNHLGWLHFEFLNVCCVISTKSIAMQCQPVDLSIMKFNDTNSLNIHFSITGMIFDCKVCSDWIFPRDKINYICSVLLMYVLFCIFCFHHASWHSSATLTDVFLCFFLSCNANARVYLERRGHGGHSSQINCVVLCIVFV
jgi:hypothetical protein